MADQDSGPAHPLDQQWERWIAGLDAEAAAEMERHYDSCAECRNRCDELRRQLLDWQDLRDSDVAVDAMECPEVDVMLESIRDGKVPEELRSHTAKCGRCAGALLELLRAKEEKDGAGDVPELSAEARGRLATVLAGMTAGAQARPAVLAADSRTARRPTVRWGLAAAAAIVALIAGVAGYRSYERSVPPLQQLARAYTSDRGLEMRVAGAGYGPIAMRRGRESAAVPELLEADAAIARGIRRYPNSAEWWHAKGRSELLHGQVDQALQSFQGARALGADSAAFYTDFAIAYFERGEAHKSPIDFTQAVELLSEALRREPGSTAALYNRGLAYARQFLFDAAARDFEACVAAEKDAGWREEARRKLEETRKRRGVLPRPARPADSAEERMEEALRNGLDGELGSLAGELAERYKDPWLREALVRRPKAEVLQALAKLARLRARTRADVDVSADVSLLRAAQLDPPYAAWRDFEILFQASHTKSSAECRGAGWKAADRYGWLGVQARLEQAGCASQVGDLEASKAHVETARGLARQTGYRLAGYRAEGYRTSRLVTEGRYREALETISLVLGEMERTPAPARRAHQFFNDQARASEALGRWNMTAAAYETSAQTARAAEIPVLESLAWYRRGDALLRLGETAAAEGSYRLADGLGQGANPGSDARAFQTFARAGLLEARNDYESLRALGRELPAVNLYFQAPYWISLARLAARRAQWTEAETHAGAALSALLRAPNPAGAAPLFRREHEAASLERVRAEWMQGRLREALESWRAYRRRDYALLQGAPLEAPGKPSAGTLRLTMAPLDEDLLVWAESEGRLTGYRHEGRWRAMQGLARRMVRLAAEPWSDVEQLGATARELSAELLAKPLAEHPGMRTLKVEARGELAAAPYRLLLDAAGSGANVAIVPWSGRRKGCQASTPGAYVRADSIHARFREILPRLPGLIAETASAMEAGNGGVILAGEDATPGALAEAAASARRFHFAGHALPWKGGVALVAAPDGKGGTEEERLGLWRLDPARPFCAEIAFFSACSTGRYEPSESVAPDMLAEAALAGGVRSVVGTLWDVDTASASKVATAFYAAVRGGRSADTALAMAIGALRSTRVHPYYWAAFAVFETQGE